MKRLWHCWIASVVWLWFGGCTSLGPSQYAVMEGSEFTSPPGPKAMGENFAESLKRSILADGYRMVFAPRVEDRIRLLVSEEAFRKSWDAKKTETKTNRLLAEFRGKRCVEVNLYANSENPANLAYYRFAIVQSSGLASPLSVLAKNKKPAKSSQIGGGDVQTIGDTTYYTPYYSYDTYHSMNWLCTKKNIVMSKGFSIIVQPRYKRGLPYADVAWVTNTKDIRKFKPPSVFSEFERKEFINTRQAQLEILLKSAYPSLSD